MNLPIRNDWKDGEMGLFSGVPSPLYHKSVGLSVSGLKDALISPAHWLAQRTAKKVETDAMRFGTALHAAVLEPEMFACEYAVLPEGLDKRTKAGKAIVDSFGDKMTLTFEENKKIDGMVKSIKTHPTASAIFASDGMNEVSGWVKDPDFEGIIRRFRMDRLVQDQNGDLVICDIKTVAYGGAAPLDFAKQIADFRYAMQDHFYCRSMQLIGYNPLGFLFIAVEKDPPFAVGCYMLDPLSRDHGQAQCLKALEAIHKAQQSNKWQAYADSIEIVSLPSYATKKY